MHDFKPSDEFQNDYKTPVSAQRQLLFLIASLLWTSTRILKTILVKNQTHHHQIHKSCHHKTTNMARSISSLQCEKDIGGRGSSTSSDSEVSPACDRGSDMSSANSDSSELLDTSSTYSGNRTGSTTAQVDFDHKGETSPIQSPFSPQMVDEHQRRPEDDGLSSYARELRDLRALYLEYVTETGLGLILVADSFKLIP
ncbi:hypothetical protein FACUT_3756 [Fusarium acutatum]|uniref:Uncharacterized protein n=1 Tax=Fusarium acutatum TaxID=78861 RepID=A0A8H4NPZ7_9HYPO|nr:hypothetical protein FACUT_3756 [Fusarium acutatum]